MMEKKNVDLQLSLFEGEEKELIDLPEQIDSSESYEEVEVAPEEIIGQINLFEREVN